MCWLNFHYSIQAAHRTYCSPAKGTSESHRDPKDKPIRFSTSKARRLTLNQTLGDMNKKTSNKPMYIGFITMAILTYIIFFLPGSKEEAEEWELLEDAGISTRQSKKGQWQEWSVLICTRLIISKKFTFPRRAQSVVWWINSHTCTTLYVIEPCMLYSSQKQSHLQT